MQKWSAWLRRYIAKTLCWMQTLSMLTFLSPWIDSHFRKGRGYLSWPRRSTQVLRSSRAPFPPGTRAVSDEFRSRCAHAARRYTALHRADVPLSRWQSACQEDQDMLGGCQTVVLEKPLRVEDVQRGHARAVRAAVPAGPMLAQALAPGWGRSWI